MPPKTAGFTASLRVATQALLSVQLDTAEQAVGVFTRQEGAGVDERAVLQERAEARAQLREARLLLAQERAQCERVTELMVGLEARLKVSKEREDTSLARLARLEEEQACHPMYRTGYVQGSL